MKAIPQSLTEPLKSLVSEGLLGWKWTKVKLILQPWRRMRETVILILPVLLEGAEGVDVVDEEVVEEGDADESALSASRDDPARAAPE